MKTSETPLDRLRTCLDELYSPEQVALAYPQIVAMLDAVQGVPEPTGTYYSEQTITLITYGDSIRQAGTAPLATLHRFLKGRIHGLIDTVHILPFYPYSSDDGFSVIDYLAVDSQLGTWKDIEDLGGDFRLMFDAVINHMSAQSPWFRAFLAGDPAFDRVFLTESPATDLSMVVRPRTTPLLTSFTKDNGEIAHVWTTFSADQVDLDYRDPQTLIRMLGVLLFYIEKGAQVLRLDAIAYLWKRAGTTCIHLPETHAVIQFFRAALDRVAPHIILITETNVPHAENISYFGSGLNEAQLVYNFALPPLLLHTLTGGNAQKLCDWVNDLKAPSDRSTFFNFTASHDGIGVRPVEGILTPAEVQHLIDVVEKRGGRVSYKGNPDGSRSPYELNITYVDALSDPVETTEIQVRRFLLSQAIMLTLAGIPAIYIHSLLGSRNNVQGMAETGQNRTINRAKLVLDNLETDLASPDSFRSQVFRGYSRLIQARIKSRAFHPNGAQRAIVYNAGTVFALERFSPDRSEHVLALFNVSDAVQTIVLTAQPELDLLTENALSESTVNLIPYETRWLRLRD